MGSGGRSRLDRALVDRGLVDSRNVAQGLIMAGRVRVDGRVVDKAGAPVDQSADIALQETSPFVSRAGHKLQHALEVFGVEVNGACALDVGASTGGFTDALLQAGAKEVAALDVGYGQLDERLRRDSRVTVLERFNARYLLADDLPFRPDLITVDVSFISLRKVMPALVGAAADRFRCLALVKPQFEAGPDRVGKGGIVRDRRVHADVLRETSRFVSDGVGVDVYGVADSGLPGMGGNREFFIYFGRGGGPAVSPATLDREIADVTGADA